MRTGDVLAENRSLRRDLRKLAADAAETTDETCEESRLTIARVRAIVKDSADLIARSHVTIADSAALQAFGPFDHAGRHG
jgi:hypothetical protein